MGIYWTIGRTESWEWEKVKDVRVPNMRRGGTVDRSEWVSYHGWDGGGLF